MKIIKTDCHNIIFDFRFSIFDCIISVIKNQKSKIIAVFLLTFLAYCETQAQQKDFKFRFDAKVIDADTTVAISRCHIINKTQNIGTISDEFGFFTVTANTGDSIMFSSIGYERLTIAASDSMYSNNRIVKLKPAIYLLSEIEIGLLSTYDRFKRDILSREAQEAYRLQHDVDKYAVYKPPLPNQGGINIPMIGSPVTYFYYLLSTEGKQYRHYMSIINGTAEFMVIGEKFNGFMVKDLTGFENDELIKFMSYCRFTKDYLLAASETDIRREIARKYREYIINDK